MEKGTLLTEHSLSCDVCSKNASRNMPCCIFIDLWHFHWLMASSVVWYLAAGKLDDQVSAQRGQTGHKIAQDPCTLFVTHVNAYGKGLLEDEHQWKQADLTWASQVRTTTTWIYYCTGQQSIYKSEPGLKISSSDSSTWEKGSLAHIPKLPTTQSSSKGNLGSHSLGHWTWLVLAWGLCN